MSSVIDITALHKRFGRRTALHGLELQVQPGTIYGLIGPNGAGKTTTLRTLVDIIRPTSGQVRVLGEDPRHGGARLRRRIGYVPGELHLEGRVTGHRMLSFYSEVSGAVTRGYASELAERLGVDLSRPVRSLSKGNKQKVGLIQAFMHRPELLILDEPTSGLDPLVQREFLAMVREARDGGQTVLLSSHVLSEIQQVADEVAVLAAGRVVATGDVASLRLGSVRRVRVSLDAGDPDAVGRAFTGIPGVSEIEITPQGDVLHLTATVEGAIDPFVKALAQTTVRDLTVEEPDLEESVLRLYSSSSSPTPPPAADTPTYGRPHLGVSAESRGVGGEKKGGAR
ncbi:ABC transporter ATP-binding protein [Microbacterium sp. NPDC089987]|uniref:ABC transporter ATP-binding protein n=1 Tax=Microbacterium sp. NPDC089987 TaxID=3364202 RepID=UPI003825245E